MMFQRNAYQRQHRQRGMARIKSKRNYMRNRNKYKLKAKQRYRRLRNNSAYKRKQKLRRTNPSRFRRIQASGAVPFLFLGKDGKEHEGTLVGALCDLGLAVYLVDGLTEGRTPIGKFFERAVFLEEEDIDRALDCLDRDFGVTQTKTAFRDNLTLVSLREEFENLGISLMTWRNTLTNFARSVHGTFNPSDSIVTIPFAGNRKLQFRMFLRVLPGEVSFDFIPLRNGKPVGGKLLRMFQGPSSEAESLFRDYARFLAIFSRVVGRCQTSPEQCVI